MSASEDRIGFTHFSMIVEDIEDILTAPRFIEVNLSGWNPAVYFLNEEIPADLNIPGSRNRKNVVKMINANK